ncbi:Putative prophage protein [Dickeya dadantii 3937]|nr:Putative prophage protein [Dickeya dadantii 3937]
MVGRNGGAFGLAGSLDAGLLTLLRLTTLFSSGMVRFINQSKRPPLWLLPLPSLTLNLPFCFWPCIVPVFHTLAARRLLPLMNAVPAAIWSRILFWSLPVACQFRRCAMFDNTPLELEEIIDQCRALAYAIVELEQPEAKEILMFILWERLDCLYRTHLQEQQTPLMLEERADA